MGLIRVFRGLGQSLGFRLQGSEFPLTCCSVEVFEACTKHAKIL